MIDMTSFQTMLLSVSVSSLLLATSKGQELRPCSVCRFSRSIGLPGKLVDIPGVPGPFTCEQLNDILPIIYPDNMHPDCQAIQNIGAFCGCPIPENSCTLCEGGAPPLAPKRPLSFFQEMAIGNSTLPIIPNCESTDAFLKINEHEDSSMCTASRSYLAEYCQCPGSSPHGQNVPTAPCSLCKDRSPVAFPDEELGIIDFPFRTCSQLEEGVATLFEEGSESCALFQSLSASCGCPERDDACRLCRDGSPVSLPDKALQFLQEEFDGFVPTCKMFESYTKSLPGTNDDQCGFAIKTIGNICGCPSVDQSCIISPGEEFQAEYKDVVVPAELVEIMGMRESFPITCEIYVHSAMQTQKDDYRCFMLQTRGDICGFNNGDIIYGGAKNDREKIILAWLPRLSGILSVIGSSAVLFDALRFKTKRRKTYHQIMGGMSFFDILSSCGWIVSTAANPIDDIWPIYGERGNQATCATQAFMLQLSLVTLAYNVSLMAYYYIAMVLVLRGERLKAAMKYLHVLPAFSSIFAFAGIPFYGSVMVVCHIEIPPLAESWLPVVLLFFLPILLSIAVCTIIIIRVWIKVRGQVLAMQRWQFTSQGGLSAENRDSGSAAADSTCRIRSQQSHSSFSRRNLRAQRETKSQTMTSIEKVEQEVLWQALTYTIALYITWLSNIIMIRRRAASFGLTCVVFFLTPLQGALNSCNYFRPRIERYLRALRNKRATKSAVAKRRGSNDDDCKDAQAASEAPPDPISIDAKCTKAQGTFPDGVNSLRKKIDEYDAIHEPSAFLESCDDHFPSENTRDAALSGAPIEASGLSPISEEFVEGEATSTL